MKEGLIPKIGMRSLMLDEQNPAVYFFTSKEAAHDALQNWLLDLFDDSEELCLLQILTDCEIFPSFPDQPESWEVFSRVKIPPEHIKHHEKISLD